MDNIPSTCCCCCFFRFILFSSYFFLRHPVRFFALLILLCQDIHDVFVLAVFLSAYLCCCCWWWFFCSFVRLLLLLFAHSSVYSYICWLTRAASIRWFGHLFRFHIHTHSGHIHLFSLCYIVFGYLVYSIDIFTRLI